MTRAEARSGNFVRPTKDGLYVRLRVSPGAKTTAIKGMYGESAIKLSVAAPPVEGKANAEIERFLSALLGAPRSDIAVVKGAAGRDKLVRVRGVDLDEIRTRLDITES